MNADERVDLATRLERKLIGEDPHSTSVIGQSRYRTAFDQAVDWIDAIEECGYRIVDAGDPATIVCEAIKAHLAHGGKLPWPSIAKPYAAWADGDPTAPEQTSVRCRGCRREWVPTPLDDYYNPGAAVPPPDHASGLCLACLLADASTRPQGAEVDS